MTTNGHDEAALTPAAPPHEHGWRTRSRHRTSQGVVVYVQCTVCDALRVDVESAPGTPPSAASSAIARDGGGLALAARSDAMVETRANERPHLGTATGPAR